ncbi:XRE family transcriptional regulator [Guyparkeria halophila]|uniref:XRE family transcriptional regulator n=1 Tax=Guyparkeria halophila TaxID=47960 RepID=A0ABZ0YVG6_9GAMM|nr:XRE family transcriptional regulator [Guyparkeria halophila]WQH16171.1 XRE family transcriptional regulator [Guyparkeria halophila]
MTRALAIATQAWGDEMPDWIRILAAEVDVRSQRAVADAIGYSPAVISQALKGRYQGNTDRVRSAVMGAFAGATVACPVLGDLPQQDCLRHQRAPFSPTNPMRVRLYRACHSYCPHRHQEKQS